MPGVINYKICDLANACGGLAVCPTKAFSWNKKLKKPEIDNKKCTSCGICVAECPVEAIVVTRTEEEFEEVLEKIRNDPRSEKELWRERLGCQPGRTPPLAVVVTPNNFEKEVLKAEGLIALDVWSEETLDCRYHSVLWDDLGFAKKIAFKKLDAGKNKELAQKLKAKKLPSLLFFKNSEEVGRREGYLYHNDMCELREMMGELQD